MNRVVLAIQYKDEPLCINWESISDWFDEKGPPINREDENFLINGTPIQLDYMPKIQTLSFGVALEDSDEDYQTFPQTLFDFIGDLKDNKTIVSLAECFDESSFSSNCELIYEAELKKFIKVLLEDD